MDIAKLVARLELQSSQFQTELEKTNRKLLGFQKQSSQALSGIEKNVLSFRKSITSTFGALGIGVSIGAITNMVAKTINLGDEIGKAAVKSGIATKQFSELAFAARQSDISLDDLSNALRKMQVSISQTNTGSKSLSATFKAIGIDFQSFRELEPDQQFEAIADGISKLQSPADKARVATELFSRAGANLLPMFEKGAQGIREARMEAEKLGMAFSDDQIAQLQKADDAVKNLTAAWQGFATTLTVAVAPALTDILNGIKAYVSGDYTKNLSSQLKDLAVERNRLFQLVRGMEDGWVSRFLLGKGFDKALASARAQLASVEKQMNSINSLMVSQQSGAGGSEPAAPGFGAMSADIPSRINLNSDLWVEFAKNIEELESVEKQIFEQQQFHNETLRDFITTMDEQAGDVTATIQTSADSIAEVGDKMGEVIDRTKESAVVAEEFTRSLFGNISDLLVSIGNGSDQFATTLLNSFKRVLADSATRQIFKYLGSLGGEGKGGFASFIGSVFGGYKAEGGPLQQGKWYVAGEHGPEPIWGGGPGAYAMGYGGGGGAVVNLSIHNDNRGATTEFIRQLPEHDRRLAQQIEATIVTKLKRRQYNL